MENRRNTLCDRCEQYFVGMRGLRTHQRIGTTAANARARKSKTRRARKTKTGRAKKTASKTVPQGPGDIAIAYVFGIFHSDCWNSEESWGFTMYIIYNLIPVVIKFHNKLGTVAMNFYVENIAVPAIQYGIKYVKKE
ncbi:hypothetical protein HPULCUR_002458 [Helicostylum pulchrum]|uniref:C2H2-type domain-containing protein n=1 Tax=Helicostylum pulchrum TaxID=562976 RepID=A0ABP9XQK0_9FUNG